MSRHHNIQSLLLCGLLSMSLGCTAEPGLNSLVRFDAEPAGANCANGGTAIHSGVDDDGDGTLSDAEIDQTAYACNGADGTNGMDGTDGMDGAPGVLIDFEEEPPGANCEDGGVAINYGTDDNGNNVLDADEVDDTTYVCDLDFRPSGVLNGTYTMQNDFDVWILQNVTEITGALIINDAQRSSSGPPSVILPSLEALGSLLIYAHDVAVVELDGVTTIEGNTGVGWDLTGDELQSLSLSSLVSCSVSCSISGLALLSSLDLSSLTTVNAPGFSVSGSPLLPACEVQEIIDTLVANGFTGSTSNSGNDETATCP